MAIHKSAIKRAKQSEKARIRNASEKTKVKNLIKKVREAADQETLEQAREALQIAIRAIDKARSHGIYHQKTASRKISRLAKLVDKIQPSA